MPHSTHSQQIPEAELSSKIKRISQALSKNNMRQAIYEFMELGLLIEQYNVSNIEEALTTFNKHKQDQLPALRLLATLSTTKLSAQHVTDKAMLTALSKGIFCFSTALGNDRVRAAIAALEDVKESDIEAAKEMIHRMLPSTIQELYDSIKELRQYGGEAVRIADTIERQVTEFLANPGADETAVRNTSEKIKKTIIAGKRSLGNDRTVVEIFAHIVLALTGVGLIIMLGKKFLTDSQSVFLSSNKHQKKLSRIDEGVTKVIKR